MLQRKFKNWSEERPLYALLAVAGFILFLISYLLPENINSFHENQLIRLEQIIIDSNPNLVLLVD